MLFWAGLAYTVRGAADANNRHTVADWPRPVTPHCGGDRGELFDRCQICVVVDADRCSLAGVSSRHDRARVLPTRARRGAHCHCRVTQARGARPQRTRRRAAVFGPERRAGTFRASQLSTRARATRVGIHRIWRLGHVLATRASPRRAPLSASSPRARTVDAPDGILCMFQKTCFRFALSGSRRRRVARTQVDVRARGRCALVGVSWSPRGGRPSVGSRAAGLRGLASLGLRVTNDGIHGSAALGRREVRTSFASARARDPSQLGARADRG